MIVVSDTSPLNYLAIIGCIPIVPALFGEVAIPPAVAEELADPKSPQATRDFAKNRPTWLSVRPPSDRTLSDAIASATRLGRGEREAIGLAIELRAELLLTDDRRAAREARTRYGLRVTGLLGVLELGTVRGLVDLPAAISSLEKTSFRMPKAVVRWLLERDAARRGDAGSR